MKNNYLTQKISKAIVHILFCTVLLIFTVQSLFGISPTSSCGTGSSAQIAVNTSCATTSFDFNSSIGSPSLSGTCASGGTQDGWGWFNATGTSTTISADNDDGNNVALIVYSGSCASLTLVNCVNSAGSGGTETMTITTVIGSTYFIRLVRMSGTSGDCDNDVCVFSPPPPPPANNDCSGATAVACGGSVSGNTTNATNDAGFPACTGTGNNFRGVWHTITPAANSIVTLSACTGTSWDSYLRVFSGACGSLTCITNDDDGCGTIDGPSTLSFTAAGGTTYRILLSGQNSSAFGAYTLSATCVTIFDPCLSISNISGCGVSVPGSTQNGAGIFAPGGPYATPGTEKIWTFTAPFTGTYILNVTSFTGTQNIQFFGKASSGGCNQNGWTYIQDYPFTTAGSAIVLTSSVQYYFMIDDEDLVANTVTWNLTCPPPPPANDNCAGAITVACGGSVSGNTNSANDDAIPVPCTGSGNNIKGVWHTITPTLNGIITLSTCTGTSWDSYIRVFTGASCASLTTCVANNNDFAGCGDGTQSQVTFNCTANTTYYILITGDASATGNNSGAYTLTASCVLCTTPPVGGTASGPTSKCTNSSMSYSVSGGSGTYQWQYSTAGSGGPFSNISSGPFTGITGETSAAVGFSTIAAGTYYFVCQRASAGCSAALSNVITTVVSVGGGAITATSNGSSVCPGGTVDLNANDSGGGFTITTPAFATVASSGTSVALTDESVSSALPIGFNFNFYGNIYSQFYIGSNGFITFNAGSGTGCCAGGILGTNDAVNNVIAFSWDDLLPTLSGNITYYTTGSTPNRSLVVNFNGISHYTPLWPLFDLLNIPFNPITSQVVLYETSNIIRINTTNMPSDGSNHTMGLENANGSLFHAVPGRNSQNWSASNESQLFTPLPSYVSFAWTGPNGYTFNGINPPPINNFQPVNAGTYSVTGTTAGGCQGNGTINIVTNPAPIPVAGNQGPYCAGQQVFLNSTPHTTYSWSGPNGFNSTGIQNPSVPTPQTPGVGTNTYTLTVTNSFGCSATTSTNVIVNALPIPSAIAINLVSCNGNNDGSVVLSSTGLGDWLFTDGNSFQVTDIINNINSVTFAPLSPGTYSYHVIDANGCENALPDLSVIVNEPAVLIAGANNDAPTCPLTDVHLDGSATGGTAAYNYSWTGPNGFVSSNENPTIVSADYINEGTYTVEVTDAHGCTSSSTTVVDLQDLVNPVISCPANITVNNDPGICGAIVTWAAPVGTDNCPQPNTVQTGGLVSGSIFPLGLSEITYTVTDHTGNSSSCSFNITVIDNEVPTISCPADILVNTDAGQCGAIVNYSLPSFNDNCPGSTVQQLSGLASGAFYPLGTTVNTFKVNDASGNSSINCSFSVTVQDVELPNAVCQNLTIQLDAAGNASITAAQVNNGSSDACGIENIAVTPHEFTCLNVGPNTVTLTVTDNSNNSSTCTAIVTVEDNTVPVATCQNVTVQLDASGNGSITAAAVNNGSSDACGIQSLALSKTVFTCADILTNPNPVTLTVTDNNGNVSTCTATVTVVDDIIPVATCQNITIQLDASGNASTTATAVDNGSNDACGIQSLALSKTAFTCADILSNPNLVTLTVTDNNGNVSTCTATVTVEDNIAPVATCQNVTVQLDASGNGSITAAAVNNGSNDACGIQNVALSKTAFTCADLGSNNVTLTVTDENGNSSTCTATVTVEDNILPVISCPLDIIVFNDPGVCGAVITFADPVGTDNCTPTTIQTVGLPSGTVYPVGLTFNTFEVTDLSGNSASCSFFVLVIDNENPTINCPANIIVNNDPGTCGAIVNYAIPTGLDNCPGESTVQIQGLPSGSFFPVGTTVNTYRVTDAYGQTATCSFTVIVVDNEFPVFSVACPANFSSCNPVTWTPPVASDNCSVTLTSNYSPGATFPSGTTIVTYTAIDPASHSISCSFNVTLQEPSVAANNITSNRPYNNICAGENITLTLNGGFLGDGAVWKWYRGSCAGILVATGVTSITVAPGTTTTYFVRAEGICNNTACVSLQVIVSTTPPPNSVTIAYAPPFGYVGLVDTISVIPVPGATFYLWTKNQPSNPSLLIGGNLLPSQTSIHNPTITFTATQQNYNIKVLAGNACGRSNNAFIRIRGTVSAPASISGSNVACANGSGSYTSAPIPNTVGYHWSLIPASAGTIVGNGNQTVTVNFAAGFTSAQLCCHGQTTFNLNGPDFCMTISNTAPVPGAIAGNVEPCQGGTDTYTIAAVPGANSYIWTAPSGSTIVNNGTSADITFPAGVFSGNVCVSAVTVCGPSSAPSCLAVTSGQVAAIGSITGPTEGICGATLVNYQLGTSGAILYTWSVPAGATIAFGQGTNSINVNFPSNASANGNVSVIASFLCGTATTSLAVTGSPSTPTVPNMNLCANQADLYTASSSGADSYSWTVSPSGTIFYQNPPVNNEIGIQWGSSGNSFSVVANNLCGSSAAYSLTENCRIKGDSDLTEKLAVEIYPNPTHGGITLEFNSPASGKYIVKVTDLTGRLIRAEQINAAEGLNQHQMDLSTVSKGMYLFNLQNETGENLVIRVVVE